MAVIEKVGLIKIRDYVLITGRGKLGLVCGFVKSTNRHGKELKGYSALLFTGDVALEEHDVAYLEPIKNQECRDLLSINKNLHIGGM